MRVVASLVSALAVLAAPALASRELSESGSGTVHDGKTDDMPIPDPIAFLEGLWNSCDKNADGCLSYTEFVDANNKLGIPESAYTSHGESYQQLFDSLNTNTTDCGGITKLEIANAVEDYPEYQQAFIHAFTNGAGEMPTGLPTIPTEVLDIDMPVVVEVSMKVSGSADQIYPGQRQQIRQFFADSAGVSADAVVLLFKTIREDRRRMAPSRALQSAVETQVTASIYVADSESASAASATLSQTLAPDAAAPAAFDGVTILSASVDTREPWSVPVAAYAFPPVLIFLCFVACCCAKAAAAKRRAAKAIPYDGCCKTGCCGYPAVTAWATWEFLAAGFLLVAMLLMYVRAVGLKDVVVGLIRTFLDLVASPVEYAQQFANAVPPTILATIEEREDLLKLLPIAVIVPGALACVCLLIASACPFLGNCAREGHKGSYCCTKCFILLANLVMIVAFVFYAIFSGVSLFLAFAPPNIRAPIEMVTLQCDIVPAQINQMIEDGENALLNLEAAGQNTTAMRAAAADITALAVLADGGCQLVLDLFLEFERLFLPAAVACSAIVFAFFLNNFLCCAVGCCSKDTEGAGGGGKANKGSVQMTSIGLVGA